MEVTVKTQIGEERIKDLLCGAFEGGSNYWYQIQGYVNPERKLVSHEYIDLPFIEGCGVMIGDIEDQEIAPMLLNKEAIEKGLQVMADKYNWHFLDFFKGNDDATTSDVFLQCCLFGEIVYG
jgi:hypothetical protein